MALYRGINFCHFILNPFFNSPQHGICLFYHNYILIELPPITPRYLSDLASDNLELIRHIFKVMIFCSNVHHLTFINTEHVVAHLPNLDRKI